MQTLGHARVPGCTPLPSRRSGTWSRASRAPLAGSGSARCTPAISFRSSVPELLRLHYPGEPALNLAEYMVVLDKPIGLTLAPDPGSGKIVVQDIRPQSPADLCQLVQVGDVVTMCSAVFGDDMWQASDLRRVKWAITNRTGKVKLILERRQAATTTWYSPGVPGSCSTDCSVQLPVSFAKADAEESWSQDLMCKPGKCLGVAFHGSGGPASPQVQPVRAKASGARFKKLQRLRDDLLSIRSNTCSTITLPSVIRVDAVDEGMVLPYGSPVLGQPPAPSPWPDGGAGQKRPHGSGATGRQLQANRAEKQVVAVLPWLLVASGRLDARSIAHLAGQRGLSALLELGIVRSESGLAVRGAEAAVLSQEVQPFQYQTLAGDGGGNGGALPNTTINSSSPASARPPTNFGTPATTGPTSVGYSPAATDHPAPTSLPASCDAARIKLLLHAAASLQRLACRRGGSLHRAHPEHCAVLLHCEAGLQQEAALLLAGWLHWYGRLPLQEASLAAEVALSTSVDTTVLQAATAALLEGAKGRAGKVVLTWKYGGLSAFVAGDIVGSWSSRVPLLRCRSASGCKGSTSRGHFFLEIHGLQPSVYYYKYIIDGTWTVDPNSPKVLDSAGNWNNVLEVHHAQPVLTSNEGLALARWQAAHLAFENKMGLPRKD